MFYHNCSFLSVSIVHKEEPALSTSSFDHILTFFFFTTTLYLSLSTVPKEPAISSFNRVLPPSPFCQLYIFCNNFFDLHNPSEGTWPTGSAFIQLRWSFWLVVNPCFYSAFVPVLPVGLCLAVLCSVAVRERSCLCLKASALFALFVPLHVWRCTQTGQLQLTDASWWPWAQSAPLWRNLCVFLGWRIK